MTPQPESASATAPLTGLAAIEARTAITETKLRYCRCLDTKDWAGFADCFTEDLTLDTRPAGGAITEGRDVSITTVRGSIDAAITVHQVHGPEITFVDADTAHVIWAMQDRVIWPAGTGFDPSVSGLSGFGHYTERYVRCADGRWRIRHQVLSRLHTDLFRTDGTVFPAPRG
jgi:hypothetical protein